ncbi:MAG: hypothetical protein GF315_02850 [candidate division Zixibacteria bacterium]|nr:hypothetical protein [candidate division Zixibacteria bacterium]
MTFWMARQYRSVRYILILVSIVVLVPVNRLSADSCMKCHQEIEGAPDSPTKLIVSDIHYRNAISCADCHGGDPTVGYEEGDPSLAMDPEKGYIGVPSYNEIPKFCSRCHSDVEYMRERRPKLRIDQHQLYLTSVHGKRLKEGDKRVAQCVSCHGAHGILSSNDVRSSTYVENIPGTCANCHANEDYMARYGIPTDQYDEYSRSVHGRLLFEKHEKSAPTCNSCHGNHGAAPLGLASIAAACGQCHGINQALFDKSPHFEPWKELGIPECIRCHNHHLVLTPTDNQVGVGENSFCIECHSRGDNGYEAAAEMSSAIDSLKMLIDEADSIIRRIEMSGVDIETARYNLTEATDRLIEARNKIHSFNSRTVRDITKNGISKARHVIQSAEEAGEDMETKQKGLLFTSILIIILAGLLFLKIRQIEGRVNK